MTIIVDNTGFSVEHWSRFNESDFIQQNIREGVFKQYAESERRELLKQTYQLIDDIAQLTKET